MDGIYFASIDEISVYLEEPSGDRFRLKDFPVVLGRNSDFKVLRNNVLVSRQHCTIDFDRRCGSFLVTPFKTGGGTYLNGKLLQPDTSTSILPGDDLVLSGVVLRLVCCFASERSIRGNGQNTLPGICLPKDRNMLFLSRPDDGEWEIACENSIHAIAAFLHNLDSQKWKVLAIDRRRISIDGNAFVECDLTGGESLAIDGCCFEFNVLDAELVPIQPDVGSGIKISDLRVGYGDDIVLDNITCEIPGGKLTAILGQSGCGKSTFVKVLSGQKQQAQGEISAIGCEGHDYSDWAHHQVALVPQHDVVHEELTVRQCIEYAADIRMGYAFDGKLKESVIDKVLRETELENYADHCISDLSGGQRKRVNIAVEVVGRPKVLMLDEPTSGLDYAIEKQIIATLRQMSRQGKTVLFVTHSLAAIEAADHVIVLKSTRHGARVAAEGAPDEVQREIGIESWEDLYSKLKESADQPAVEVKAGHRVRHVFGFSALLARYLAIWSNNWRLSALLLLGLPLLLGLLIRCAVSIDAPLGTDRLVFGLVAMFWIGMNQTVREVVKEKAIFIQEHSHGVSSFSYLLSKIVFFFFLTLPQAFLMALPIMWLNVNVGSAEEYFIKFGQLTCPFLCMLPMMWFAGFIGSLLGLLLSSISLFIRKGEVASVLFAVIATLPQLLYTANVLPDGLAKPLTPEHYYRFVCWNEQAPIAEVLSYFTFSRYLFLPIDAISTAQQSEVVSKAFCFNCGILVMAALTIVVVSWLMLELFYDKTTRS